MFERAKEALQIEADSILELIPRVDEHFGAALEMILHCPGRIIVTGMGKSGIIGRKIAATLASTGTPSFFLHPAEAIHGDLGMVTQGDVILAISNSGETGEVLHILPSIRRIGARIIAMVGKPATLAFGDALAMELLSARHFTENQFAIYHPGGSLGRKLLLTVGDIMHKGDENPLVPSDMTVKDALFVITDKGLGAVSVVDGQGRLKGLLTDGDIRRGFAKSLDSLNKPVSELMTKSPKTITARKLAAEALHLMESNKPHPITVLPVVDEEKKVVGLLHMTDLVHQGVV